MPSPSQRLIGGLAVAACATLAAGIVSAFSVGNSSASSTVSGSSGSGGATTLPEVTTVPEASSGGTEAPALHSTTTTAGGHAPATPPPTTAAPLPAAAGPVGDPGQPTAEAPGTYLYNYSETGSDGTTNGTLSEKVRTTARAGSTTRQSVVDTAPDVRGNRNVTVEWRPAGNYETREVLNFNGQSATCVWNPQVLRAPTGLAVGRSWPLQGGCQISAYGQQFTVKLTGTAKVTEKKRVLVGADPVNVWVLSGNYTVNVTNPTFGSYVVRYSGTQELAASIGMVVQQDATTTVSQGTGPGQSVQIHEAAKSIHPAA